MVPKRGNNNIPREFLPPEVLASPAEYQAAGFVPATSSASSPGALRVAAPVARPRLIASHTLPVALQRAHVVLSRHGRPPTGQAAYIAPHITAYHPPPAVPGEPQYSGPSVAVEYEGTGEQRMGSPFAPRRDKEGYDGV